MNLQHLSTSTPASDISSADFARNDGYGSDELNVPSIDDIMRNSPVAALLGLDTESLPEDEDDVPTPDDSSENDVPENEDDAEKDLDEDKTDDKSDEDKADEDDTSTQQAELPSEDDIDWEYRIPITVDGKTEYKTLEEVRKGYSTDQHLSQKGRELGEQKKLLEQERNEKLQELVQLGSVLNAELTGVEANLSAEYHKLSADIEKAREDGDTYTVRELKEQREAVQEKYWAARTSRESKTKLITEQWQQEDQKNKTALLENFNKEIKTLVPEYSEKTATAIREFALKEGIPDTLLDSIYDVRVVKFINEYRKLKTAKETGEAKRKTVTSTKSVPTKNGTPAAKKQQASETNQRAKVLSGNGSNQDQLDFLKRISSVSKKL